MFSHRFSRRKKRMFLIYSIFHFLWYKYFHGLEATNLLATGLRNSWEINRRRSTHCETHFHHTVKGSFHLSLSFRTPASCGQNALWEKSLVFCKRHPFHRGSDQSSGAGLLPPHSHVTIFSWLSAQLEPKLTISGETFPRVLIVNLVDHHPSISV